VTAINRIDQGFARGFPGFDPIFRVRNISSKCQNLKIPLSCSSLGDLPRNKATLARLGDFGQKAAYNSEIPPERSPINGYFKHVPRPILQFTRSRVVHAR
jgi:hypothetical protein